MPAFALSLLGLGLQIAGTVGAFGEKQQSRAAQKETQAKQRRLAEVRNIRERRRAIAQSRVARAQATARTAAAGAGGGSIQKGLEAGATAEGAREVGFLAQSGALVAEANIFAGKAGEHAGRADLFGAAANIGSNIFTGAGGFETIFSPKADTVPKFDPTKFKSSGGATFGRR